MDEIVFGGDATDIPPGTYRAKVKSIVTKTSAAFGDFRAWDFELENGSIVGGATSLATGSSSKAGRWIIAILGRKPEAGEKVDLIGKECLVTTILDDKDWPKVEAVLAPMVTETPKKAAKPEPVAVAASTKGDIEDLPF